VQLTRLLPARVIRIPPLRRLPSGLNESNYTSLRVIRGVDDRDEDEVRIRAPAVARKFQSFRPFSPRLSLSLSLSLSLPLSLPLSLSLYVPFFHLLISPRAGDTLGLMVVFSMLLLRRDAI